ncbi:N-6 DNA methylase [Saccharopolyspora hirsuta]|uniref:N-6 DNA methylase n=1 Tax=Saccharopolyspora hirsuta TaxID=1837 RepID=UPI00332FB374
MLYADLVANAYGQDAVMSKSSAQVTAAEISRLAGVTRATVSNWRRRHPDFPAPAGGTETSPAYDLAEVRSWLAARGQLPEGSPADELRNFLREGTVPALRLLPLVSALAQLDRQQLECLAAAPDLPRALSYVVGEFLPSVPGEDPQDVASLPTRALRVVLDCVVEESPTVAVDVLAEHLGEDVAAGAYSTPQPLADLMATLALQTPSRVLDPACGAGGLLSAAARMGAKDLYGQEVLVSQAALASVRVKMASAAADVSVEVGDSLRADAFAGLKADAVLSNPPYSVREWGHDELAYDPRWEYGLPPKSESELAWVQHCIAHLEPGGLAVVLMPPGTAERAGGRRIRTELVRKGALRGVVALPPGAAPPLHIGLHLWLLASPDPAKPEPQPVLFVDVSDCGRSGRATGSRELDWPRLSEQVVGLWRQFSAGPDSFEAKPGLARSQPVVDLLDQSVDLTPARHVRAAAAPANPDRQDAVVRELRSRLGQASSSLVELSGGVPWPPAGVEALSWRTATVADLLRGGAVSMRRASAARGVSDKSERDGNHEVLSLRDVWAGERATGSLREKPLAEHVRLQRGDVVIPETLNGEKAPTARVVDAEDAGVLLGRHLYLLRPDPERLDPWFLAGFLSAEENVYGATTGTSIVRLDVKRLRVPLLPLEQQRDYGRAFKHLHEMRVAARAAAQLADETARELAVGLTSGALLPPGAGPVSS